MEKSKLGFWLGLFFGILGLLGLLSCCNQSDKDEFMAGWVKSMVIGIIISIILISAVFCGTCTANY